jgi:hypothetical protein
MRGLEGVFWEEFGGFENKRGFCKKKGKQTLFPPHVPAYRYRTGFQDGWCWTPTPVRHQVGFPALKVLRNVPGVYPKGLGELLHILSANHLIGNTGNNG